ncbi:protein phosphatase 1 regulatory subunit 12B isoform X2 [Kryptolebias marmoratus]|uniref:protein phosphatase 1 regulatory subunit 12B isoform X2 n=1 Tax=Kryptolebias marmoratus TaxID=37003 RepID=UPI0007F8D566|nr:protein phosphatase 1 regulatory subunit 12B isoform X2 [Kryptolebias marmoratus]
MQAFVPRLYLTPLKDEEAESQRKAKSRHARQTRRSTQGVTLTDLKEAQRTYSLSHQDREQEEGGAVGDRPCLRRGFTDDSGEKDGLTESTETTEIALNWNKKDEEGNIESRLETLTGSPDLSYLSVSGSCDFLSQNFFKVGEKWWRDENQNVVGDAAQLNSSTTTHLKHLCCDAEDKEHERLSRYDSTGESATEKALGRTSSYTRRETRLAALNRQEQESAAKDYKKMYTEALHENERLKSRLQDSKQELVKIRSQLEKVTQRQDRMSERSAVLESEKREKQVLEKKVSDMEEEVKVLTELKSDNQRLKDENGALIRVISKLSK